VGSASPPRDYIGRPRRPTRGVRIDNQGKSVCAVLDVTQRTARYQLANSYNTANIPSADELHNLSATARQVFDNPEVGNPSYNVALGHTQKLVVAVRTGEPQSTRSAMRNRLAVVVNRARGRRDKGKWCARVGDASRVGADNDAAASVDEALSQATGAHPDKRGADGGGAAADADGGGSGAPANGRAVGCGSGAPLDVRGDGGGASAPSGTSCGSLFLPPILQERLLGPWDDVPLPLAPALERFRQTIHPNLCARKKRVTKPISDHRIGSQEG